jgi:hypothetical protein
MENICRHKMNKILIQHTPMIHFQEDQPEAILRASDLIPRLNKYIIKLPQFDKSLKEDEIHKIDEFNKSLKFNDINPYKLKISPIGEKNIFPIKSRNDRSLYFGKTIKNMISYNKIMLNFLTYDDILLKLIDKALPYLFATENFGTRQNKGYGSFYLENENNSIESIFSNLKLNNIIPEVYYFIVDSIDPNKLFSQIYYFYNTLKGGINEGTNNSRYSKSLLFKYLKEKDSNLIWEKRYFKKLILGDYNTSTNDDKIKYIRNLLGFTTDFTYRSTYNKIQDRNIPARMDLEDYNDKRMMSTMVDNNYKVTHNNEEHKTTIQRAPSPLFIKPVLCTEGKTNYFKVYIILRIDNYSSKSIDIRKEKFTFNKIKKTVDKKNILEPVYSNVTSYPDFDLRKFMEWVYKVFNKEINTVHLSEFVKDIHLQKI